VGFGTGPRKKKRRDICNQINKKNGTERAQVDPSPLARCLNCANAIFCSTLAVGAPMPGPPIGGGPAAGTTTGDAITLTAVSPVLLSGDSSIPTDGEELGVRPGVPIAGEPPVVSVVAAGAAVDAGLSSEGM
jgi:hypothetical protein